MGKKIIVTGATGMAGSEVIHQALLDPEIEEVAALVRRPLPQSETQHAKLKTILHEDFLQYANLSEIIKQYDACIWCLGISQTQVNAEEYHVITYDYTLAAARAMLAANPDMTFIFLSGMGADSKEKSRTIFARVKGKTENALRQLSFKQLYLARPGGIRPIQKKKNLALYEKLLIPTYLFFEILLPFMVINSVDLAKAMLKIAKQGSDKLILSNNDLRKLVK